MRRLSFQWRITFMTSLLIALTCITLNLLVYHSGAYYFDTLGKYVEYAAEYNNSELPEEIRGPEDLVIFEMTPEEFESFYTSFIYELTQAKTGFGHRSWLITAIVTLLGGVIAYFVSGRSLKPLREFCSQTEQIQMKTLTEIRLNEDTIPEFQALSGSVNRMLTRLSAAFDAQRQFVGNAAHELRTPLALMQTRVDLYEKENPEPSHETEETLALIKEQTDRLSRTVKTLLDMSELETIPRTDRIELSPMIEEILTDLEPLAEAKNVTLTQAGENLTLIGSDVLIYRLLFNLIENAIKYNRPDGRVVVSAIREGNAALICVRDTGSGIPKECRESVFQPFFRVDKSRSRALGGVGLGLSLVWEIVRLHNGTVQLGESGVTGTAIAVRLPLSRDQGA